jgi:hypothetical protein
MSLADSCIPPIANIAATSTGYAQMAGLLSGFAFTALVMLLTPIQVQHRSARQQPQAGQMFMALFTAFVALLFTTLAYCVLAGEDVTKAAGRASTEELVDGLPFGLAFIMLFHGLALLLNAGNAHGTAVRAAHIVTVLVSPVMVMFYLANAVPDTEATRAVVDHGCPRSAIYDFSLLLTGLCLATLGATLAARHWWHRFRDWTMRARGLAATLVLAVCAVSTLWAGDLASRGPNFLISSAWLTVYLEVTWFLVTGVGVLLIAAWPPPDPGAEPARHRVDRLGIPRQPSARNAAEGNGTRRLYGSGQPDRVGDHQRPATRARGDRRSAGGRHGR